MDKLTLAEKRAIKSGISLTEREKELNRIRAGESHAIKAAQKNFLGSALGYEIERIHQKWDERRKKVGAKLKAKSNTLPQDTKKAVRAKVVGQGMNCEFYTEEHEAGLVDLFVFPQDKKSPTGYAINGFQLARLTKEQLTKELVCLRTKGFVPTRGFSPALIESVLKVEGIYQRLKTTEFDTESIVPQIKAAADKAVDALREEMTVGLLIAFYFQDREKVSSFLENPKRDAWSVEYAIYDILGNAKIPTSRTAFQTTVEGWAKTIANAKVKAFGRSDQHGGIGRPNTIRGRLTVMHAAFEAVSKYSDIFPWAVVGMKAFNKQSRAQTIAILEKKGEIRQRIPYRCLYREEIKYFIDGLPDIDCLSFFFLNLSTGLRPEIMKTLRPEYFDQETGSLLFWRGVFLAIEAKPGGINKRVSKASVSVVVRLILSMPEIFNVSRMPAIKTFFENKKKQWHQTMPKLAIFAKKKGIKAARHRDFRNTCAKNLLQSGLRISEISHRLGNTDDVAEGRYAEDFPPDAHRIAPGISFYEEIVGVKVEGSDVEICRKDPPWDGWLLLQFLIAVKNRKKSEFLSLYSNKKEAKKQTEAFYERLRQRVLDAYHYEEKQQEKTRRVFAEEANVKII